MKSSDYWISGIEQIRSYITHYEITCNAFELDKTGLGNHVKKLRDEMIKESREFLDALVEKINQGPA